MVPEGWVAGQVSDICRLQNGRGFKPEDWDTEGLPIIRIQNLNGSKNFNYFSGEPEEKWLVEPGQMLFAWAGTKGVSFGPTVWRGETGVLNQHIFKVFQKDSVDHDWLYLALRHVTDRVEGKAHGFKATLVHVKKSDIEQQPVAIPPLPEQKKIAEILSTWDRAIETAEALLATARTQKRALMQTLLTGKRRFPEFEGQEWREVRLGDVVEGIKGGGTPDKSTASFWNGNLPWVSVKDLKSDWLVRTEDQISEEGLMNSATNAFPVGTVVVATRMAVGVTVQLGARMAINQDLKAILPGSNLRNDYLFYFMQMVRPQIEALGTGSTVKGVTLGDLRRLEMWLPKSLDEQDKIVNALRDIGAEIDGMETQLQHLRSEKKALMQQLLTGKRRVKA